MKILAIESSGMTAGCALEEDGTLIGDYNIQLKKTHSQTLVPMINELKTVTELDLHTLDAIAVTKGPGSFTGLRIGAATAKGMGLALEKPIIPISTLESLAFNLYGVDALICPLMDAKRGQVFTGIYTEQDTSICLKEPCCVKAEEILKELNERGKDVIFVGDGVDPLHSLVESILTVPHRYAPSHLSLQRAASTAILAEQKYEEQKEAVFVSSDAFRPVYLRVSSAEQQRKEKELQKKNEEGNT